MRASWNRKKRVWPTNSSRRSQGKNFEQNQSEENNFYIICRYSYLKFYGQTGSLCKITIVGVIKNPYIGIFKPTKKSGLRLVPIVVCEKNFSKICRHKNFFWPLSIPLSNTKVRQNGSLSKAKKFFNMQIWVFSSEKRKSSPRLVPIEVWENVSAIPAQAK